MKKIVLFLILCFMSFSLFSMVNINALVLINNDTEYLETFGFSYDLVKKNGVLVGDNPVTLNSGSSTTLTYLVSSRFDLFTYPEAFDLDDVYFTIEFFVPISNQTVITSSTAGVTKEIIPSDLFPEYASQIFTYHFNLSTFDSIAEFSISFQYTTSNPAVVPSVNHASILAHYSLPEEVLDNVVDCGTDYSLLPDTNEAFINILSLTEYDHVSLSYKFTFIFEGVLYSFNLAIPEEIYNYDYISPYEEDPVNFVDFTASQMSFATGSEGETVLYIQPVSQRINHPVVSEADASQLVVGFITINLTTMEYEVINKLELVGIINKEANRFASLYCFFPAEVEELLTITVSFNYRINTILGIKGDWQIATNTYVHGESYEGSTPNWIWWIPAVGWGFGLGEELWGTLYDVEDVVVPINKADIPDEVTYKYVNDLDGTLSDLNNLALYKVSLGQFQDGLFTAATDENAYDISEFVILEILYSFDGAVYLATSNLIDSNVITPELSGGLFSNLFGDSISSDLQTIIWIGVGVVAVVMFNKLKLDKKPGLLIIIVGGIVYILYKLGFF